MSLLSSKDNATLHYEPQQIPYSFYVIPVPTQLIYESSNATYQTSDNLIEFEQDPTPLQIQMIYLFNETDDFE